MADGSRVSHRKAEIVAQRLRDDFCELHHWEDVARKWGLPSRAHAWNIANGKQRPSEALFARITGLDKIRRIAAPDRRAVSER